MINIIETALDVIIAIWQVRHMFLATYVVTNLLSEAEESDSARSEVQIDSLEPIV